MDKLGQAGDAMGQAEALCAIEVAVHREQVYLTGRLASDRSSEIDIPSLVRGVYASAGYGEDWRPAPADVMVGGNLCIVQDPYNARQPRSTRARGARATQPAE